MPIFETESLVLKSYNLAEADRIVVFLTRDFGIVRGVAKGAKRLKSRFGSMLEPFSTVTLEYFQKEDRELVGIRHIDLIDSRFERASEPEILHTFYRMAKACIDADSRSPEDIAAIRLYFELWLLRLGGYLPDWNVCNTCKRALESDESADVQADFHLLCGSCRKTRGANVLSGAHREAYRSALKLPPSEFMVTATGNLDVFNDVSTVLRRIISSVLGRELVGEKTFAVNSLQ